MATLEEALSSLDPQIKHELNLAGDDASLLLYDPSIPAFAQRRLVGSEIHNQSQFRMIVLYAVNELSLKGSHAELKILPMWDSSQEGGDERVQHLGLAFLDL